MVGVCDKALPGSTPQDSGPTGIQLLIQGPQCLIVLRSSTWCLAVSLSLLQTLPPTLAREENVTTSYGALVLDHPPSKGQHQDATDVPKAKRYPGRGLWMVGGPRSLVGK